MKVIGIIFILSGHLIRDNVFWHNVVYLVNIPIFFFVSGILWKKRDNTWEYYGKKVGFFIKKYALFSIIFVIFHNLFVDIKILNASFYTLKDFLFGIISSFFFSSTEPFSAAMWFIPMYILL